MSDIPAIGLPEAASRLGVSIRALRRAIHTGRLPAPPQLGANAALPAEWFARVQAAVEGSAKPFLWGPKQKVPPFARYEGTSAWRKYRHRVREYARHQQAAHAAEPAA